MANSKSNIYPIQLQGAELNLNKLDAEIKQYSGFNKNNSPFVGGCLSNVFTKEEQISGGNADNTYIDENGDDVGLDNSDQERQARGITRIVGEYLQDMKSLGVYDDATIIITSDHGDWYASMEMPTESTEPILLVKPSGSGSEEGIKSSNAPVSHADFHASVLKAMGASADVYSKYGYTYEEIGEDMQRTRTFYHIFHDLHEAKIRGWLKYEITGDVTDFSNWTYTGDMWETDYTNVLT